MFCPNCDRVYLKTKVCPHCGVELLRATGKPKTKKAPRSKPSTKTSTEIRCPECGSTKYRVHKHIKYKHSIKNSSLWVTIIFAVVYLWSLIRGWNRSYCCCECGYEWSLQRTKQYIQRKDGPHHKKKRCPWAALLFYPYFLSRLRQRQISSFSFMLSGISRATGQRFAFAMRWVNAIMKSMS